MPSMKDELAGLTAWLKAHNLASDFHTATLIDRDGEPWVEVEVHGGEACVLALSMPLSRLKDQAEPEHVKSVMAVIIQRDQALENLQLLHAKYKNQYYGLDNATDDEIVDYVLGLS